MNMRTNQELRRLARKNLAGNYRIPMGAVVFTQLLSTLVSLPFTNMLPERPNPVQYLVYYVASFLIVVLTGVLGAGELKIHLNLARKEPGSLGVLFYGFKNKPDRFLIGAFISLVLEGIWLLPAVFVGLQAYDTPSFEAVLLAIILAVAGTVVSVLFLLNMAVFTYLLLDYPNATVKECFVHSFEMMKGHKGRYFALCFSFVGFMFLSVLSFGIGIFWTIPYMNQTMTLFYLEIKGELSSILEKNSTSQGYSFQQYV